MNLYLALYFATFCLHAVLVSYVVIGTAWVLASALRRAPASTASRVVQDNLPFALGLAITMGVAPLLFVQVLHQRAFYTANLLLSHRFMLLLVPLIAGFYLLYALKALPPGSRWRAPAAFLALMSFLFVGYSWSENHVLSKASTEWVDFYASGRTFVAATEVLPRFAFAVLIMVPIFGRFAALELRQPDDARRSLAFATLIGAAAAGVVGVVALPVSGATSLAAAGLALVIVSGLLDLKRPSATSVALGIAGVLALVSGMAWVRMAARPERFERTVEASGASTFAICGVIVGAALAYVVRTLLKTRRAGPASPGGG